MDAYTTDPQATTDVELQQQFERLQLAYNADPMPAAAERSSALQQLASHLKANREALCEAISSDFGHRSVDETLAAEFLPCLSAIQHARKHLRRWMKPEKRAVDMAFMPAKAQVVYQPLGVVGIIVPWNYPLYLSVGPLICALAAGNRVMLKLSEFTPAAAQQIKSLLASVFSETQVCVVLGGPETGIAFSQLPFDHLLFTGSTQVGRHILSAAAPNLTPVTLELGGKSPTLVSASAPLAEAAERIAFGKAMNAGQTCVAPDYVLVPAAQMDAFKDAYQAAIQRFFPTLEDNADYTTIINERQLRRLQGYLDDARSKGAQVEPLYSLQQGRRMPHTVITNVDDSMQLMQEEIFGPLLPLVPYDDFDEALAYINARPRPLALYYFGYDKAEQTQVLERVHAGGVCINETLLHVAQSDLPFGGIGPSGMGHYHGREGFKRFSHAKAVLSKGHFNPMRLFYPPYNTRMQKLVMRLLLR